MLATKNDRSTESLQTCKAFVAGVLRSIEELKLRLAELKSMPKHTSEINREIAKIDSAIEDKQIRLSEVEKMQEFPPGSWVVSSSNRPGRVADWVFAGQIPEVHVHWSGNTVPVPERPFQLRLVQPEDVEYIWNGDRYPKLVRRIDRHECDEIEILQNLLARIAVDKRHAMAAGDSDEIIQDYKTKQTYLRKRVSWVNQQDLEQLERVVRQGLEIFYRVGEALAEIRDRKLYKDLGYSNFRDYLMERWNMKKSRAYQLIYSAEVVKNLSTDKSVHPGGQNEPIAYESTEEPSEMLIP